MQSDLEICCEVKLSSLLVLGRPPPLYHAYVPKASMLQLTEVHGLFPLSPVRITVRDKDELGSNSASSTIVLLALDTSEEESPWRHGGNDKRPIELRLNAHYKMLGFSDKSSAVIERVDRWEALTDAKQLTLSPIAARLNSNGSPPTGSAMTTNANSHASNVVPNLPSLAYLMAEWSGCVFADDSRILVPLKDGSITCVRFLLRETRQHQWREQGRENALKRRNENSLEETEHESESAEYTEDLTRYVMIRDASDGRFRS